MNNEMQNNEMKTCFARISPIMSEFLEGWVLTGHRVGCKTKVILGDYDKNNLDLGERMLDAQDWKQDKGEDYERIS